MRIPHALTLMAAALAAQSAFAQDKGHLVSNARYRSSGARWRNEFAKQTGIKVNTSFRALANLRPGLPEGPT